MRQRPPRGPAEAPLFPMVERPGPGREPIRPPGAPGPPMCTAHPAQAIPSGEREATVPVQMELRRIIINEINEQQYIMLREVDGDRSFPIVIGMFEALSIDRR